MIKKHQVPWMIVHVVINRNGQKILMRLKNTIVCVHVSEDIIEGLKSVAELNHLSSQNRVLRLNIHVLLGCDVDVGENMIVFLPQLG